MNRTKITPEFERQPRDPHALTRGEQFVSDVCEFAGKVDPLVWWVLFVLIVSGLVVLAYPAK